MTYFLQAQAKWFFSDYQFKLQTYWFKKLLYTFVIVKMILWLLSYDLYFGDHSIVFSRFFPLSNFRDLAFLLYANPSTLMPLLFIILLFIICLAGLRSQRQYFVPEIIIWFLMLNLNNKIYPMLSGGDYLLNQFLLFNCFLSPSSVTGKKVWSELKILLHNLGAVALIVQVCMVYFLSALAKCNDKEWISGTAITGLIQIKHFNMWHLVSLPDSILVFLDYLVLFYQLAFPALIWIKRIKKPFIVIGLGMHLYIIFVMGLVEFGIVMILAYIYFWPIKKTVP